MSIKQLIYILREETKSRTFEGVRQHCLCACAEGEGEEARCQSREVYFGWLLGRA